MDEPRHRPWWAVAIAGGFGAVLAVLAGFGMLGAGAHGESHPQIAKTDVVQMEQERLDRLTRIEARLNEIERSLGRIEGRLERK